MELTRETIFVPGEDAFTYFWDQDMASMTFTPSENVAAESFEYDLWRFFQEDII